MDDKKMESLFKKEISKVANKVDFSEIDEIQEKLEKLGRSIKPHKISSLFLIALFAFASGYGMNIYRPIVPISDDDKRLKYFKNEGLKLGENKNLRYIMIPDGSKIEIQKIKGGTAAVIHRKGISNVIQNRVVR